MGKKGLPAVPICIFFMFIVLISNHMPFLFQFGINFFKKAEIALAKAAHIISSFYKLTCAY